MSKSEEDREEWIAKKLKEAEAADGRIRYGQRASAVTIDDRQLRAFEPQSDARADEIVRGVKKGTPVRSELAPIPMEVKFELPAIQKRDAAARTLSMSSRLWKAAMQNPMEMELLLQRIQSDLWQKGRPVAFDDIRRVAEDVMKAAQAQEDEKHRKMVSH